MRDIRAGDRIVCIQPDRTGPVHTLRLGQIYTCNWVSFDKKYLALAETTNAEWFTSRFRLSKQQIIKDILHKTQ